MSIAKAACLKGGKTVVPMMPMTVLPQAIEIVPNESHHSF